MKPSAYLRASEMVKPKSKVRATDIMKPIASLRFKNWQYPEIKHGKLTRYNWLVLHPAGLSLSPNTDIGAFTLIQAEEGVIIEENVQIGSHCAIYSVSTIDNKKGCVWLKKGCKIGSHTVIMPGVTIGEGAIIGACSFVKQDVPAGETWFGVPAKKYEPIIL